MRRFTWLVAVLGFSALVGCSDVGVEPVATGQEAIVNGMISSSSEDAVVQILTNGNGCSGTLISPTVVLTALHCVTDFDPRFTVNCQSDGTQSPGSTTGTLSAPVDPSNITVGVGVKLGDERVAAKAVYGTGSTDVCHDDLAVIVLKSAPDIGGAALTPVRFTESTHQGEIARIVGYGGVEQTSTIAGRQTRSGVEILGVGGPDASTPGDTGVTPRTVKIGEGPCHGDSGGPIFDQETGAEIGVYSLLQSATCTGLGVRNTYTLIAPFEPLIRMALESEGAEPILEPGESVGAGGEAGATSLPNDGGSIAGGSSSGGSGGGSDTIGEGAGPANPDPGSGTGSFHDSSCALRSLAPRHAAAPWLFASALVLVQVAARRRARRRIG